MVQPITQGDRGPAVEDVQKRLLSLGFDLGPTGIDGVFLGATLTAVRSFQRDRDLAEDGVVGDETWSALVDATFRLGDRLLYLKHPYLHGADVHRLQGALNVLGFACGEPDGIFGAFTERAVGEFQANVGLPADGIAGPDTVGAIERLRHVWDGKDPAAPAALTIAPARAAEVLRRSAVTLVCGDRCARAVAERVANLARAAEPEASIDVSDRMPGAPAYGLVLHLSCGVPRTHGRVPVIAVSPEASAEGRFIAAFRGADPEAIAIVLIPEDSCEREHEAQGLAVRILDGVCAVLSAGPAPVVP
ncbi:MAG: peptidoglycan-binding protein [Actinobacteria bacterium]|nr:peptidoglycan-binding protein [Actinomycetota bacterium]